MFSPDDTVNDSSELWHDPVVRRATAALVELYAERWPGGGGDGSINGADGDLWARHFASSSYGDQLFARCLALLLQPAAPEDVQVGHWFPVLPMCCHPSRAQTASVESQAGSKCPWANTDAIALTVCQGLILATVAVVHLRRVFASFQMRLPQMLI